VRMPIPAPAAHEALLKRGAHPFPEQPWDDLATRLSRPDLPAMATPVGDTSVEQEPAPLKVGSAPGADRGAAVASDRHSAHDDDRDGVAGQRGQEVEGAASVYTRVLPVMLSHLHEPRDVETLAKELEVLPRQLQAWLDRALADGMVTRTKRPVRYVARTSQKG